MQRMKVWFCILFALVILAYAVPGLADAGDFAGSSDWDSSDWGSSDSDWGSSDSDWGWSSSGSDEEPGLFMIIAVVITLYVVWKILRKKGSGPQKGSSLPQMSRDLSPLHQTDPKFSEEAFLEQVRNRYVQLQNAWQAKELEPMRPLLTETMFAQLQRQMQGYIDRKQTNRVERIAVLAAEINGFARKDDVESLRVYLRTRICDYVVSDETGNVVRGDPNKELFMEYAWTFTRPSGTVTRAEGEMESVSCPNCGAPLEINMSTKCPYCDSVVTLSAHDWALSEIRGISQKSGK